MLDNESDWLTVYNGAHSSADGQPIGSVAIPGFFNQHIIRAYSNSLQAKPSWWLGGRLIHILGTAVPDFEASRWLVPLRKKTLIQLPKLTNEYRLKFEPANWVKEIALVIEVYTGQ